jgi:SAM-dependent methyltransferase
MLRIRRIIDPIVQLHVALPAIPRYFRYLIDWYKYSKMEGAEPTKVKDAYPCLNDRSPSNPYDRHYFYQDVWAFQKISESKTAVHVDVGSRAIYVGMLTIITKVIFVDIRPLLVSLENFESRKGDILSLPFDDGTIQSLSCLHVAEHIGLGRYGDPLDPYGTEKAIRELSRILSPGGNLYFSLPIGVPRIEFNAHRIHAPSKILEYFHGLELHHFSAIDDDGIFHPEADPVTYKSAKYACGLFHFIKRSDQADSWKLV